MSEENNIFGDTDFCPDEQELKSYTFGEMTTGRLGRIIGCHLEFCSSCKDRVEKIRTTQAAVEETVGLYADRFRRAQEKLVVEKWRGARLGTIWRTVPESEEELFGPLVIVVGVDEDGALSVAEVSEEISQSLSTDMILEPRQSGLSFRFMVRAENTFRTTDEFLKTFAGKLSPLLTNKVVEFCRTAKDFDAEIPLSKYKFGRDPEGTMLMYRNGVTSGMLITRDDDPRAVVLHSSKLRCSYLPALAAAVEQGSYIAAGAASDLCLDELNVGALRLDEAGEREPDRPEYRKGQGSKRSLRRILISLAAGLVLIIATAKTTQVILEAPLKAEAQANEKKLVDEEKRRAEAERNTKKIAELKQERSKLTTKSVNLEAENSRLDSEIKKMAASITQRDKNQISARSEMEALKAKVSKIEGENLDLKKSNTELLAIQDGINKRLAKAEERREASRAMMDMERLEFDTVKGKAVLDAVHSGDMAALKELLREEQYVGYRDNETGITPLHMAASEGQTAVAKFLIEKGAYVNAVDREGKIPLMKAAMEGDRGMVELLLNKGADVRLSDRGGRTALYWALANKHDDIAKILRGF